MTTHFRTPGKSRPLWQVLLAPMLLASLGLHGLVLMLPAGSSDEAMIPLPNPEQDSVAITRVPPAGESEIATPGAGATAGATPTAVAPGAPLGTTGAAGVPVNAVRSAPSAQRTAPAAPAPANRVPRPASRSSTPPPSTAAQTPPTLAPTTPAPAPPTAATTPPPATALAAPAASQPLFEGDLGERLQTYVASLNLPQERIDQLLTAIAQRLVYSDINTSDADYSQNLSQWQQAVRAETGLTSLTPEAAPAELPITYYQRACLSEGPGTAQVGVIVSPVGSPRREPVLLRSSGYGIVDAKALRTVADHQFPRGGEVKAYTVTLPTEVDHGPSDCLTADTVAQDARARGT